MSKLYNALDNFTPPRFGENGAIEYTWSSSSNFSERIVQINFQLVRQTTNNLINIEDTVFFQLDKLLGDLKHCKEIGIINATEYIEYMSIIYRMIGFTRDIISGKGEYNLSYMLIQVWLKHYPELARFAFSLFVLPLSDCYTSHPYGSWKDIKYALEITKDESFRQFCISLFVNQIKIDIDKIGRAHV